MKQARPDTKRSLNSGERAHVALPPSGATSAGSSSRTEPSEPRLVQRLLIGGIHVYQGARAGRPSPCRFMPSCSAYGEEAIAIHGAAKGSLLTLKRITRCRPGGGFGVDLVPPRT
jgi:uncharacterized protein